MNRRVTGKERSPQRIEPMLKALETAWKLYPDMRLGQLIVVCAETENIFGIEDDKLLQNIENYTDKLKKALDRMETEYEG